MKQTFEPLKTPDKILRPQLPYTCINHEKIKPDIKSQKNSTV